MGGMYAIFKKNIKLMYNYKLSFLIIFFGPLFLIMVTGAALQNNALKNIDSGIYIHDEFGSEPISDDFTNGLVQAFLMKGISVDNMYLEECKREVLNSEKHVCIEIVRRPAQDLVGKVIEGSYHYDIKSYVDFSKTRIAWSIIASVQTVVEEYKSSIANTAALNAVSQIDAIILQIKSEKESLNSLISQLTDAENNIANIQNSLYLINTDLSNMRASITSADDSFNEMVAYLTSKGYIDSYLQTRIILIQDEIRSMRDTTLKLDALLTLTGGAIQNAEQIKSEIGVAKAELIRISNSIDQILNEWNTLKATLDVNNVFRPVTFYYGSVSDGPFEPGTGGLDFLDYLFSSIMMFFIIFVSITYSTNTIIKERASNAHIRNVASKRNGLVFILGNFFTAVFILLIQVTIIIFVSVFFLKVNVFGVMDELIFISLIGVALFSLVGIAVGYIFNSNETAIIAAVSLSLLFLIFLPVITPTETLPEFLSAIFTLAPFVILETKLRLVLIFGVSPSFSFSEFASLVSFFVASFLVIAIFYKSSKREQI
jgi:ABC-type polysaccharide/polyol phosphate export permease